MVFSTHTLCHTYNQDKTASIFHLMPHIDSIKVHSTHKLNKYCKPFCGQPGVILQNPSMGSPRPSLGCTDPLCSLRPSLGCTDPLWVVSDPLWVDCSRSPLLCGSVLNYFIHHFQPRPESARRKKQTGSRNLLTICISNLILEYYHKHRYYRSYTIHIDT